MIGPLLALLLFAAPSETVYFFITNDCPISNAFAPEIHRICSDYQPKGAKCELVYVDPALTEEAARSHAAQYGHKGYPFVVDRQHELVKKTGATITPEAAIVNAHGDVLYRGRIDNSFAKLGVSKHTPTELDLRNALDASLAGKPVPHPRTKALGCYISDLRALSQ